MTEPAPEHAVPRTSHSTPVVFAPGASIGVLGGLVALGGAEFSGSSFGTPRVD